MRPDYSLRRRAIKLMALLISASFAVPRIEGRRNAATRQPHQRRMARGCQLQPERQPEQPGRCAGPVRAGRRRPGRRRGRGRHRRLPGLVDRRHPGALRGAGQDRQRDPGAQGRAGHAAGARRGQDQGRRHRRSDTRGADLQVLRRRVPAPVGRGAAVGAPRHRHRDHARAGRRGRPDHAVELPDRPSRPGRSPRPWLSATAWS